MFYVLLVNNRKKAYTDRQSQNLLIYEPRREKTGLLHMRKERRRSALRKRKLTSAFIFAT